MWKVPWEALFPGMKGSQEPCLGYPRWALWGREVGEGERAMERGETMWSGLEGPGNHGKEMKPRH